MKISFLTPWALLFGLSSLATATAFFAGERRARRVRTRIGASAPPLISTLPRLGALIAVPALLAIAAGQPVVERTTIRSESRGAEMIIVLDTSRSMLASSSSTGIDRLDRAKNEALRLQRDFPQVRIGLASLTDRLLPYLFPTSNGALFDATLATSAGVDQPPPSVSYTRASSLDPLARLARDAYYTAPRRIAVVFTDGESRPFSSDLGRTLREGRIRTIFVHVWKPSERIYLAGQPDPGYRPDPTSGTMLRRAAAGADGTVIPEDNAAALVHVVERNLGPSAHPRTLRITNRSRVSIAKWFVLAALLPLAILVLQSAGNTRRLWRRLNTRTTQARGERDLPGVDF
jgi:hypothetical protein